jgi:hypothetical protein
VPGRAGEAGTQEPAFGRHQACVFAGDRDRRKLRESEAPVVLTVAKAAGATVNVTPAVVDVPSESWSVARAWAGVQIRTNAGTVNVRLLTVGLGAPHAERLTERTSRPQASFAF